MTISSPVTAEAPRWLTEDDVRNLLTLNEAIGALREGLALEALGEARNIDKTFGTWDASSMHALGSMMPNRGYVGFKTWANTPSGASAIFSLFSASGRLLAMIEAGALGQMRTSGISGLATQQLADPTADVMALIGTGAQAFAQVAAVAATRPLRELRVFSPTPAKREAFVSRARAAFAMEVVDAPSLAAALEGAPIVTLITRAREAFLDSALVAYGAHVNAAGAILPQSAEFNLDLFDRAAIVAVDSLNNARKGSSEFIARYGTAPENWSGVQTLGSLIAHDVRRPADADITLFKPMGMGLSDLSVAIAVYERAVENRVGIPLERGQKGAPRWIAATPTR